MKSGNTLAGGDISWMEEMGIPEEIYTSLDINRKEFEVKDINIIYLGWFIGTGTLLQMVEQVFHMAYLQDWVKQLKLVITSGVSSLDMGNI